jgi:hypothetical protein
LRNLIYLTSYKWQWYKDLLRFEKKSEELFHAQRHIYLETGERGWLTMESSDDLEYLANTYCQFFKKDDDFLGFYYSSPFDDDEEDEDLFYDDAEEINLFNFNDLLPEGTEISYENPEPKTGRNDACSCGSGKKYKKCCGKA